MKIVEKLLKIQTTLKAPKGQWNDFSKFKYRSCEDILEALKPLLKEVKATLIIKDELEQVGDRYYIKATAILYNNEDDGHISTHAYAREEETKKGMDASQITGTASSYARKYALNGLFAIDDTKDADTQNNKTQKNETSSKNNRTQKGEVEMQAKQEKIKGQLIDPIKLKSMQAIVKRLGVPESVICKRFKLDSLSGATEEIYPKIMNALEATERKANQGGKNE